MDKGAYPPWHDCSESGLTGITPKLANWRGSQEAKRDEGAHSPWHDCSNSGLAERDKHAETCKLASSQGAEMDEGAYPPGHDCSEAWPDRNHASGSEELPSTAEAGLHAPVHTVRAD